jgi:stress-induced-phosphoprotein 1
MLLPSAVPHIRCALAPTHGLRTAHDPNNHILYSNRSAAHACNKQWLESLADAERCVACHSKWARGYFRCGTALEGLGRFAEAYAAYGRGALIDSTDTCLKRAIAVRTE